MDARKEEESNEVASVPIANAVPDPRTVVVVHLNTDSALATVEAPGRPEDLAGGAVRKLVLLVVPAIDHDVLLLIVERWLVFELVQLIEPLDWTVELHLIQLLLVLIQCEVLILVVGHFLDSFRHSLRGG